MEFILGKKKTVQQTQQTQANTYGYVDTPVTPQIQAVVDMKASTDPTIPYRYAAQRQQLADSYNNPFGAATSPAVRDAAARVTNQRLAMDEGQATAESQYNADQQNYARALTGAQLTAPKFVQTGGTTNGTSTQTQSGGFLGDLALGLVGGASSAATAKAGKP